MKGKERGRVDESLLVYPFARHMDTLASKGVSPVDFGVKENLRVGDKTEILDSYH